MSFFRLPKFLLPNNRQLEAQLEVFRRALEDGIRRLEAVPFLNGVLRSDVAIASAASTVVHHGLGRVPEGWFVVRAQIWYPVILEIARDADTITFYATEAETLDIWFF
jgi:hypothetical protein